MRRRWCGASKLAAHRGAEARQGPDLRVQLEDEPASLDPGQTQYHYETAVLRAMAEPLLKPRADLSGVEPAAAQSYEVNERGTVYVFHLRRREILGRHGGQSAGLRVRLAAADRSAAGRAQRDAASQTPC